MSFFVNSFSILCLYFSISQDFDTDIDVGVSHICKLSSADINQVIKVCLVSVNQSDLNRASWSGCFLKCSWSTLSIIVYFFASEDILSTHTRLSNKSGDIEELDQFTSSIAFANNGWKFQLLCNESVHGVT